MGDNEVRASEPERATNTPAHFTKTALLWNTYVGDLEWFRHSAASFTRFSRGRWHSVACLVPARHRDNFREPCEQNGITLLSENDWPDKGFNWHQLKQCEADLLFPDCDAIWHMDADTVFTSPVGPENWMRDGKIICPFAYYDRILAAAGPDSPWIWKSRVEDAIGGQTNIATMTGHPHGHYRNVYSKLRSEVERVNHSWNGFVNRAQNSFPQGFCEFETLGTIAHRFYHNDYVWLDVHCETHPSVGYVAQSYSHGGLDAKHDYGPALGGVQTPRQLFQRLGI